MKTHKIKRLNDTLLGFRSWMSQMRGYSLLNMSLALTIEKTASNGERRQYRVNTEKRVARQVAAIIAHERASLIARRTIRLADKPQTALDVANEVGLPYEPSTNGLYALLAVITSGAEGNEIRQIRSQYGLSN